MNSLKKKVGLTVLVLSLLVTNALASGGKIIISDDFERAYNKSNKKLKSYGDLGKTKEGYQWHRRDYNKNGPDVDHPGILEYKAGNKGLIWRSPSRTTDLVFLSSPATKVKDFKLEFDYCRKAAPSVHAGIINFRMPRASGTVSDGGKTVGYSLIVNSPTKNRVKVRLFSDYKLSKESDEIVWNGSVAHITLIAKNNKFKVYVGKTLALDITDNTDNPAKAKGGFFTLQFNSYIHGEHGIDNWIVSTLEK